MAYTVSDSQFTSEEAYINISIEPISDIPHFPFIADTTILEDEFFNYD